ncbi:hypothetical protein, partial [Bacteroides caccae]|uniref:hypothetical protein n=1 Tax=Bacteroides caccae TaxID=47678 RepID=UPI00237BBF1D
RQRLFKKEVCRTIQATGKTKTATLLQEEISPPVSPTTCKSSLIKQYLQPLTNDIFIHIFLLSYK